MQIVITKDWAQACGMKTDAQSRTFMVMGISSNLSGRKGFDSFYTVIRKGAPWIVAAARVESVIN